MRRLELGICDGWAVSLVLALALAACSGRSAGTTPPDSAVGPDAGSDASVIVDAAVVHDAQVVPDAGSGGCQCSGEEVYRWHECVPTLELGCGPSCVPGVTDCGESYSCEPCAASSACDVEDCRPSCVHTGPAMGPVADPLRIAPDWGVAGQTHAVTISGYPFYIGALWYDVRLGNEIVTDQIGGGTTCSLTVNLPSRAPGMHPVWVSAYGGGEPWALAGFFTYSGGSQYDCVQPGFRCGADDTCCATAEVGTSCQAGRCRW